MAQKQKWNSSEEVHPKDYKPVKIEDDDEDLALSIKRKLEIVPLSHCIFKVPDELRVDSNEMYTPKVVSIGPSHHGESFLMAMEDHKWRYFNEILDRNPNINVTLENCVKVLKELEPRARGSYKCVLRLDHMESKEFVMMLLIDGCFIIELFLKIVIKSSKLRDDPLLNTPKRLNLLRHDMILFENQIPFFVLQHLFYILLIPRQCKHTLTELALRFFRIMIPYDARDLEEKFCREGSHLLDLVRSCYVPKYSRWQEITSNGHDDLDCAVRLKAAGIKIRRIPDADGEFDVKFTRGVLWIPPLDIMSHKEVLMRNVIALEQCSCGRTEFVASYVWFMKNLVRSKDDVKLLCRRGILTCSSKQKEEDVCAFFARLWRGVKLEDFYYRGICQQIREYKAKGWQSWYQRLICPP